MTFGKDAPPLPMYERKVLKHVPTMVRRRYDRDLDNNFVASLATKDLPSEDGESKCGGDGASFSDVDDFFDDEAEDESHPHFDDEHNTQTYTKDFGYNEFGPSMSMYSEDSKSKSGGGEDANFASAMDANVEEKIEDNEHTEFDNDQGICSDGAIDANTLEIYVDASVKSVVQNNEQDEDNKGEDDGTKDANIASDCVDDNVQDEDKDHGNSENKQDMQVEDNKRECDGNKDVNVASDCVDDRVQDEVDDRQGIYVDMQMESNKSEGDEIKDAVVASDCMNDSVQDEVFEKNHGNCGNKQGMQVKDNKSEGDETKHADFSPKALKKTLEQDGYDLCCPNCKNYITHTMIFRRREDCQQHKTTCYSFLITLCNISG